MAATVSLDLAGGSSSRQVFTMEKDRKRIAKYCCVAFASGLLLGSISFLGFSTEGLSKFPPKSAVDPQINAAFVKKAEIVVDQIKALMSEKEFQEIAYPFAEKLEAAMGNPKLEPEFLKQKKLLLSNPEFQESVKNIDQLMEDVMALPGANTALRSTCGPWESQQGKSGASGEIKESGQMKARALFGVSPGMPVRATGLRPLSTQEFASSKVPLATRARAGTPKMFIY